MIKKGDVVGYVFSGTGKSLRQYAFSYVNGKVQLATPIGGKFNSVAYGISSNGMAIIYRYLEGKKHQTPFKWDVVSNKLSPLFPTRPISGFFAQYINSSGDLVGSCNAGACFVSGETGFVMTKSADYVIAGPFGVNDSGFASGWYSTPQSNVFSLFTYINGTETEYDMPQFDFLLYGAVSSNNVVAGSYKDSSGRSMDFRWLMGPSRPTPIRVQPPQA